MEDDVCCSGFSFAKVGDVAADGIDFLSKRLVSDNLEPFGHRFLRYARRVDILGQGVGVASGRKREVRLTIERLRRGGEEVVFVQNLAMP